MKHIYYYNITYYCNNECVFCFSNSTGKNNNQIDFKDFCKSIDEITPQKQDIIVLNGGEPTIHPDFYKMLKYLEEYYECRIVVYSNGLSMNIAQIPKTNRLCFIIPIHGEEEIHDRITRNKGSYCCTLKNLQELQRNNIRYSVKFILNNKLLEDNFDINLFLVNSYLNPEQVFIARLNETRKSKENRVLVADYKDLRKYLLRWNPVLQKKYSLKYLDIPFCCCLENMENRIFISEEMEPEFFFNDYINCMRKKNYYREIMIGKECKSCIYCDICKRMSKSYKTLCYDFGWKIDIE